MPFTPLRYGRTVNGVQASLAGAITGGLVLRSGSDRPAPGTVRWSGSTIEAIDPPAPEPRLASGGAATADGPAPAVIDATGALVLPGIVDLHGDAFERSIMPRAGVEVDVELGLADNGAQLLAAGVTTAFLSATDSWEPGLRSRETLRRVIAAISRRRGGPDVRLHVRHERCNTTGHEELVGWIEDGTIGLLSFNDHTPGGIALVPDGVSALQAQRAGVAAEVLERLQQEAIGRRAAGREQERDLAETAVRAGCVTASHDADDLDDLRRDLSLGVTIAEFPTSIDLAHRYRREGIEVLFGAPNLVRGRSHLGNLSVAVALRAGVGTILCSDYHYPSLLQAPFAHTASGEVPLGEAWSLVAERPARAAGLVDRGRVAAGARADLLVVEPPERSEPARVRAAVVAGRVVLLAPR